MKTIHKCIAGIDKHIETAIILLSIVGLFTVCKWIVFALMIVRSWF